MEETPDYLDAMTNSAIYDARLHADRRELHDDHVDLTLSGRVATCLYANGGIEQKKRLFFAPISCRIFPVVRRSKIDPCENCSLQLRGSLLELEASSRGIS